MHLAHIWAIRGGPYLLGALGTFMVVSGVFAGPSDAVDVSLVTVGAFTALSGAVLPRTTRNFEVSTSGLKADLLEIPDIDPGPSGALLVRALPIGPVDAGHELMHSEMPSVLSVLQEASRQGWAVARTTGGHPSITKFAVEQSDAARPGDLVTVVLPGTQDGHISPMTMQSLERAGFRWPPAVEHAPMPSAT
jgi:hypothetical protein